jgi:hypothetical protein
MSNVAIYKSTAAEFIDDFFSGDDLRLEDAYDYALGLLDQDGDSLADVIERFSADRDGPSAAKAPSDHWLQGPDVDRVMREGYLEAIRAARAHEPPVPIETLWMTGAGDEFEMHVCDGERRVIALLSIPRTRDYGSEKAKARSFAFRAGRKGARAAKQQTSGPRS